MTRRSRAEHVCPARGLPLPVTVQPGLELSGWKRPGDEEALRLIAAHPEQPIPHRGVLDALGHDPQSEGMGEID